MPKLTKRAVSPYHYAWITDPVTGKKKRKSTHERNQRTAQAVAERAERAAHSPYSTTTLEAACNAFLTQRAALKAKATQEFYRAKIGTVLRLLGPHRDLATVTAAVVDKYVSDRLAEGTSRNTIGKELTALRGVLKLARRHKQYPHALDEVLPERWQTGYVPRERWCPPEEVWRIIGELPIHRAVVVAFHVATGSNLSECMHAQREDIQEPALPPGVIGPREFPDRVFLRGTKRETRRRLAPVMDWGIPFMNFVLEHVTTPPGRPMFADWTKAMRWDLKRVCERLGIPGVSSNDFRRTYSQWLRQAGVDPKLIGAALGHADGRMVERVYGRVPIDMLRPMIDRQLKEDGK